MYNIRHHIKRTELVNIIYFMFHQTHVSCVIGENVRKIAENRDLDLQIYDSENILEPTK